jgi:hypothetical protein
MMIRFTHALALAVSLLLAGLNSVWAQGGPQLALSATFSGENKPIAHGLIWRVFKLAADGDASPVAQSADATPILPVPPGEYVVHVAYGLASTSRKVLVGNATTTERVPISAGALTVKGSIQDQFIPINRLQISVYIPESGNSEGKLVTSSLRTGEVLRLPEGTYTWCQATAIRTRSCGPTSA